MKNPAYVATCNPVLSPGHGSLFDFFVHVASSIQSADNKKIENHYCRLLPIASISMASSSSLSLSSSFIKPKTPINASKPLNLPLSASFPLASQHNKSLRIVSSSISSNGLRTGPYDLVASILSKVTETDGGVSLTKEGHQEVADAAQELQKYCVDEPVKCPLIFGEWDMVYCSRPTSPGGGYRSALGRLVLRTKEMIQEVEPPDTVRNKVSFSALGFLDGEVSLKGKLKALDDKWIQVIFEPPELKVGALGFKYGGESEVKLQITYIDEKIRLGKGSRGSLFVFKRSGQTV